MSEPEKNSVPQASEEKTPASRAKKKSSVVTYLAILFAAAFLLLLLAYFMQQRTSEQAMDALSESITSAESLNQMIRDNRELRAEVDALKKKLNNSNAALDDLEKELALMSDELGILKSDADITRSMFDSVYVLYWAESCLAGGDAAKAADVLGALPAETLLEGLRLFDEGGAVEFSLLPRYDALVKALEKKGALPAAG